MNRNKPYEDPRELERELFAKNPRLEKMVEEQFDRVQLARQLKGFRETAGLTQAEVARRSGLKQPNVARIEAGTGLPDLDTISRLARGYGRTFELVFSPPPKKEVRAKKRLQGRTLDPNDDIAAQQDAQRRAWIASASARPAPFLFAAGAGGQ